jgi:proteasome activator-like protein
MSEQVEVVSDEQRQNGENRLTIEEPGKLLRIAVMMREMQEEVRRAPSDEAGRERLRRVYERAVNQLCESLSGDLREELMTLNLPLAEDTQSESEILIAQAQLIGWLEGLFQGIQAAIMNQQMQARHQLEQMRARGLPGGRIVQPGPPEQQGPAGTGQYL